MGLGVTRTILVIILRHKYACVHLERQKCVLHNLDVDNMNEY